LTTLGVIVLLACGASAQNCSQVLDAIDLIDPEHMIAHSIHSLTLNMIRHYFYPNATENNGIPTVNLNRSEPNHLHENAVLVNLTSSIDNYGPFFSLDMILSNMDDKMFGIKNSNILDRIAHAMHMQNMWEHASKSYKELVENPPEESKTCSCLMDTYKEGIFKKLLSTAKLIRIPDIMAAAGGRGSRNQRGRSYQSYGRFRKNKGKRSRTIGSQGNAGHGNSKMPTAEDDPSTDLYDNKITSEETWNAWKNIMKEPTEGYSKNVARDMALFMYCHFNAD